MGLVLRFRVWGFGFGFLLAVTVQGLGRKTCGFDVGGSEGSDDACRVP